jgi:hypothetical protein
MQKTPEDRAWNRLPHKLGLGSLERLEIREIG